MNKSLYYFHKTHPDFVTFSFAKKSSLSYSMTSRSPCSTKFEVRPTPYQPADDPI